MVPRPDEIACGVGPELKRINPSDLIDTWNEYHAEVSLLYAMPSWPGLETIASQ